MQQKNWLVIVVLFCTGYCLGQNADVDMLKTINPNHPTAVVWKTASNSMQYMSGGIGVGSLAYGLLTHDKTFTENGTELLITFGINIGVTEVLKRSFNRTRPYDAYPTEIFTSKPASDKSFPSGHTSQVFATATTLALQYHKWYITVPAYLWAGSVAYSRMYLGKHYPSDVLAGALVGVGSSYLGHLITRKLFVHSQSKSAVPLLP